MTYYDYIVKDVDPIATLIKSIYGYYDRSERDTLKSTIYNYIMEPDVCIFMSCINYTVL